MYSKILNRLYAIGVSDWITKEASKSILRGSKQIIRIYNWIDLDIFKPTYKDENYVLCIASLWTDNKGLSKIVQFAKENPKIDVHMIGKIESANLPKNIKVLGVVKHQAKLAEKYANASVFLNPSIQETFGKTTAEALACGLPIISTNKCVAAMEFNRKFKNTEIVEVDNALELTKAIKKLVENKDFVEKLSKNSLSGIKEYSFENMVEDFLSCFKKIEK